LHSLVIEAILTPDRGSAGDQGMRFEAVRAVVHTKGDPVELELGNYASGQLAADLFRGDCCLVIDYPNRRVSATHPTAD
jgi:hypothetical protein